MRWGQRAVAALVGGAGWLVGRLPLTMSRRVGAAAGELAYWVLAGRRRVAHANLALAFGPALDPRARRRLARANFRHLGVTVFECCRLFFGPPGRMLERVRMEGVEHLKAGLAEGRGVLYLGAHFGNWELLAASQQLTGFPLSVVVRPLDNPLLEALVARARERLGVRLIPKRRALRDVQTALARGECVGIMLDQNAGRRGVFVPFFGQQASTSRSLAVLALKTGAPVVPAFIRRLADGSHQVTLEPPIPLARTGELERDVAEATRRFTEAIERQVRAYPEQWFWVHRRWKTRPV
ncbi:MAG: lysophospholipid acyltransferase family protein [Candidatus Rokubacteria bacterium]|nr:lysophospholipid acyltransferase family protein [Candidatus Rokubacteria bacterium]